MKPCTRCKARGFQCEYVSSEDAAMHLLHLSANARNMERQGSSPEGYSPNQVAPSQLRQNPSNVSPNPFPVAASTITQTPILPGRTPIAEEAQLPTPETMMDQNNPENYQPSFPGAEVDVMSKLPFSDFLRDVLYDQSMQDPHRMAEAQGLAVLDFCNNANLDLKDIDFGMLNHWNVGDMGTVPAVQQAHPSDSVNMNAMRSKLVKIWTESPWRWNPGKSDTGYHEQSNLPLSTKDALESGRKLDRVIRDKLDSSSRDKILAIILSTCRENSVRARVASSFPSPEVMDTWIHIFLASHLCQVSAWIHYGSFSLNSQWPEWLAIVASAGAVLTPFPTLRRFGFALQEAVRK